MHRPHLTRALGGLAVAVGILGIPMGVAHADAELAPGGSWSTTVSLPPAWAGQADRVGVTVLDLVQGENGCLAPEVDAGDATCTADGGELAGQVAATVKAGRYESGSCESVTAPAALDLDGVQVARVDTAGPECLVVRFTFPDGDDDDLAQSDTLGLTIGLVASGPGGPLGGAEPPSVSTERTGGAGESPVQVATGGATAALGLPDGRPDAPVTGAGGPADLVAPGSTTVGTTTVDVVVGDDDGALEATAAGSVLGDPLALGALLVGATVLFWALFLLARRRRREAGR